MQLLRWHRVKCVIHHEWNVHKDNNMYTWREQAIIEWSWHVSSADINTLTSGLNQAVHKKTAGLHVALRRNISSPVRVMDLFEASKHAASLVVCTRKKLFGSGCRFFVSDVTSGVLFGHLHLALGANSSDGSISLKFLLETKLQSESFHTWDYLLRFRIQKLWSKLTLWEPAYDIFVLRFRPKKQQFLVALPTP